MSKRVRAGLSRRKFIQAGAAGAAGVAAWSILGPVPVARAGAAAQVIPLNTDWLFGGPFVTGSDQPGFNDSAFTPVTVPHTVCPLSWRNWDFSYENVWIYRRHFDEPAASVGNRTFVDFQGAMTSATPTINGTALTQHQGGYLPFSYELTSGLVSTNNVLAMKVDATWQQVPPDGNTSSNAGFVDATTVDFFEPGGLYRDVSLRIVPQVFIADVWANPVNVLNPSTRQVNVQCVVDAGMVQSGVSLNAALYDATNTLVTQNSANVTISSTGQQTVTIPLSSNLANVTLWTPGEPYLYSVVVSLSVNGTAQHTFSRNIGFRQADWNTNGGFYLNGVRTQLLGLGAHQIFPWTGMAMPGRVQQYDASLLRNTLQCNFVRMVHYPHSSYFLDQCDKLGLMVWEEIPGWGYLPETNTSWIDLMDQNVTDMVTRDRNHPCIVIWGVQVNESALDSTTDTLYTTTKNIANNLDGSRATSGATNKYNPTDWVQPVLTYNDYGHDSNYLNATLSAPVSGYPYLVTEAVGALGGAAAYRFIDDQWIQQLQAKEHAEVISIAQGNSGYAGICPWGAWDYQSPYNGGNRRIWQQMKGTGVVNGFRILKNSAALYQAQQPLSAGATLFSAFNWDFGANHVKSLGTQAYIFSNCTSIKAYLNGTLYATLSPDTTAFPHLAAPPFYLDTSGVSASSPPELRLDGYNGATVAVSKTYSPDTSGDVLQVTVDDSSIVADGNDATRVSFMIVDKYGNRRPNSAGNVTIAISGPGTWGTGKLSVLSLSASPAVFTGPGRSSTVTATLTNGAFELGDAGGAGAIWIQGVPNTTGTITVTITHPVLGSKSVSITATAPPSAVTSAPALDTSLQSGSLSISVPSGWTASATTPTTFSSLAAGSAFSASWTVTAPSNLSITGTGFLSGSASYKLRGQTLSDSQTLPLGIATSLAAAFNNAGIGSSACNADLDGSGNSYSQQNLTAAGFGPGASFSHNGIAFTMPNVAAGSSDNASCSGQVISLSGTGQKIGLVGCSTGGTSQSPNNGLTYGIGLSGKVSVIYSDGTVTTTQVAEGTTSATNEASQFIMDDWKTTPGHENDVIVQMSSYYDCNNGGSDNVANYLLYAAVPLIVGKTVQAVVLPNVSGIHIFAIGLDTSGAATPPAAPTNLTATPGNAQVSLAWTASSGATSYNVKRATVGGGPYTTIAAGVTATSYTDTGLTNGTTYYYVVSAVNSAGQSANSTQVSATPTASPPPAPTNLTATPDRHKSHTIDLSWTGSTGATSYDVYRSTTSGGPYSLLASGVTTTSYSDSAETSGATYYFVVTAVNATGQSPYSNQASATSP